MHRGRMVNSLKRVVLTSCLNLIRHQTETVLSRKQAAATTIERVNGILCLCLRIFYGAKIAGAYIK